MATQLESSLHISDLILQASPVVQLVMLVLVLASVFSWYIIAKLQMGYKKAPSKANFHSLHTEPLNFRFWRKGNL